MRQLPWPASFQRLIHQHVSQATDIQQYPLRDNMSGPNIDSFVKIWMFQNLAMKNAIKYHVMHVYTQYKLLIIESNTLYVKDFFCFF